MRRIYLLLIFLIVGGLSGCSSSTLNISPQKQPIYFNAKWGIVPFSNHTQTPQAGHSASSITAAILETYGVKSISSYEIKASKDALLLSIEDIPLKEVLKWAKSERLRYVVIGSINEWQYKVGLDGEPVVNVALQIVDVKSGQFIWTAVGSRTGGSRAGLTVVAQKLIASMLANIK